MRNLALVFLALGATACGSSQAGAPPAAPSAPAPAAPSAAPAAPEAPAPPASASAEPPAPATQPAPSAEPPKADDTRPARDKIYRTTPRGLEIELGGMLLVANAKSVRVGKGWGADVTVVVSAIDKQGHVLANPTRGPLAFAAKVERGGSADKNGDKRSGDATLEIKPGAKQTLKRRWPSGDAEPALASQSAEIEVGLWGLGKDAASLYPVRELFTVKLAVAANNKATALITPPASATEE